MFPLGILLAGLAYAFGYSAITGSSLTDELRALVRGEPSPGTALREGRGINPATPGLGAGSDGPAPTDVVDDKSPVVPGGASTDSTGALIGLVSIGQGGHKLRADTAAAFRRAEARFGGPILVTDSYRSRAQQEQCHRTKPTLCAAPGKSDHEDGDAIDIIDMKNPKIVDALEAEGFYRFAPEREPWHWSRGRESGRRTPR